MTSEMIAQGFEVRPTVFYGAPVGILMIDEDQAAIPGDVGNASTFNFPVRFSRVPGLTKDRLIFTFDSALEKEVSEAARELVDQGAKAITSNCGFMLQLQKAVASAVEVPVLLSSLLQLPLAEFCAGGSRPVGVITTLKANLSDEILALSGVDPARLVVAGLDEAPAFRRAARGEVLDPAAIRAEVASLGEELRRNRVGAIVMECHMLPAYAAAVQDAAGVPVFDAVTLIQGLYNALFPNTYVGYY